jgi:hypothetical protein
MRNRALEARDARICELERELDAACECHRHREAQLQGSCQSKLEAMRALHMQQTAASRNKIQVR